MTRATANIPVVHRPGIADIAAPGMACRKVRRRRLAGEFGKGTRRRVSEIPRVGKRHRSS